MPLYVWENEKGERVEVMRSFSEYEVPPTEEEIEKELGKPLKVDAAEGKESAARSASAAGAKTWKRVIGKTSVTKAPGFGHKGYWAVIIGLSWLMQLLMTVPTSAVTEGEGLLHKPHFKKGDCLYAVDPETGRGNRDDAIQILKVKELTYEYRWWTHFQTWGYSKYVLEHQKLEYIFHRLEACPDSSSSKRYLR
jgi:hypothetical protein